MERGNSSSDAGTTEAPGAGTPPGGLVAPTSGAGPSTVATKPRGIPPEDRGPVEQPGGSPIQTDASDLKWERIRRPVTGPGTGPHEDVGDVAYDEQDREWSRSRNPDGSTTSSVETVEGTYTETVDRDGNRTRSLESERHGWTESSDGALQGWEASPDGPRETFGLQPDGTRTALD